MRAPVWLAHARFDYGRMLLAETGRSVEATGSLSSARRIAADLGMRGILTSVDGLLGPQPSSETARPEHIPEPLSAREIEVLGLIVTGKSNREIAGALTISANTVANHVKSILAKTGAANRTEAASYAVKNGLAGQE